MINAFHSGVSGVRSCQNCLNVRANNIANVNTAGFCAQRAAFCDLMYTGLPSPEGAQVPLQAGNGVRISEISSLPGKGSPIQTGRALDVSIPGEGYFCIQDQEGNRYFTRSGNFTVRQAEGLQYLMTAQGEHVLNDSLSPAVFTGPAQDVRLTGPGEESYDSQDVRLAVFSFDNPGALSREGENKYSATAASGEGRIISGAKVSQTTLEGSNVDLTEEMSGLIQAQRGLSFCAKLIQTADEIENIANTLR